MYTGEQLMRLVRAIVLSLVAFGACGCFNINVPEPPDINIHGEVNGEGGNGEVETDDDR